MTFVLAKENRALPAQCGNDPLSAVRLPGSSVETIAKNSTLLSSRASSSAGSRG